MIQGLKDSTPLKKLRKTRTFSRLRQLFPMREQGYSDDRNQLGDAEVVKIQWPEYVRKPAFGIVRDTSLHPRWTKYRRFLENNALDHDIYDLHASDWAQKAQAFDIILGFPSSSVWDMEEMRRKYRFLEESMGKACYPSPAHLDLYEDKILEAYISARAGLPFASTYVSNDEGDALCLIKNLNYPIISKINPSSGSFGVELVKTEAEARRIVKQAFSNRGRATHTSHFRQKNYIYFQDMVLNDGYDIRCIVVGNWVFGYYRKVLAGDFRASGMNQVEKRELPEPAMRLALRVNEVVKSPMLVVDMLHGLDDCYYIVEFSPVCQMELPEQLHVAGVPGVYIFNDAGNFHFEPGKYWVHELALRQFLLDDYLPRQIKTSD